MANELASVRQDGGLFVSFEPKTEDEQVQLYTALNSPSHKVGEFINQRIDLVDFVAESIEIEDEDSGGVVQAVRTVLIDKDGETYQAVSNGLVNALQKLVACTGRSSWRDTPLAVVVKQVPFGKNQMLTLDWVGYVK